MPSAPGQITFDTVSLPMLGRVSAEVTLATDPADSIKVYILAYAGQPFNQALLTLTNDPGGGVTRLDANTVHFALTNEQAATISPQRLYALAITVTNAEDVVYQNGLGYLLPVVVLSAQLFPANSGASSGLSTRTLNVRSFSGVVGGVGYLDGVTTINQDVLCVVQFLVNGQPQQWILENSNAATDVDAGLCRPLDYDGVTNMKCWRRIM